MAEQTEPLGGTLRIARGEAIALAVGFVAFAVLAWFFPRSGDDWAWAVDGGDRLRHLFAGYNGRYAGNLLIMLLMTSRLLAVVVVSGVVSATAFLILHVSRHRTCLGYGLVGLLYLAMPLGVWRQGVVWLSGFVNYTTGGLAVLLLLALLQAEARGRLRPATRPRLIAVVVIAVMCQLFMEHVTLCLLLLSVGATIVYRKSNGRFPTYLLAWASGAVVGTVLMFSNSAYRHAASGTAGYQSTSSSAHDVVVKAFDYIPTNVLVLNTAMNIAILVFVLVIALLARPAGWQLLAALAVVVWGATLVLRHVDHHRTTPESTNDAAIVVVVLAVVMLLLSARAIAATDPEGARLIVVAVITVTFLSGPLMIVNPLGPRCFYPSYVVLLAIVSVLGRAAASLVPAIAPRVAGPVLIVGTAVLGVVLLSIYVDISHAVDHRVHKVRKAVAAGRTLVTIRPLPHSNYVHDANPFWSGLVARYERYYDIKSDIMLKIDPNPWIASPTNPDPQQVP